MSKIKILKSNYLWAIVGMIVGVISGLTFSREATQVGPIAKWIIEIIKWVAMPLLFFAILETFVKAEITLRGFLKLIMVTGVNGFFALVIGLTIVNLVDMHSAFGFLRQSADSTGWNTVELFHKIEGLRNFDVKSLLGSPVPKIILAACVLGVSYIALQRVYGRKKWHKTLELRTIRFVERALQILFLVVGRIVYLIPVAIACGVARAVGENGLGVFKSLLIYALVMFGGMILQIVIVYQAWAVLGFKLGLTKFWKTVQLPAISAFGINSSLATLPLTLKALKDLGVRDSSARLSACIGTNFNNDGILLYEVIAVNALLIAFGAHLDLTGQVLVAVLCLVATFGSAGVPEAGMMTLTLLCSMLAIPADILPLLLAVDWLVGRMRSTTNVMGDIAVGIGIEVLRGRTAKTRSGIR